MISRTRPSFWRAYERLSEPNRKAARRAYAIFTENPDHPSLRFKKLGGYDNIWSVRVNEPAYIFSRFGFYLLLQWKRGCDGHGGYFLAAGVCAASLARID